MSSLALVLRELGYRGGAVFGVICTVVILIEALMGMSEVIISLRGLYEMSEGAEASIEAALKILGLTYAFGVSADICCSLGEAGIAKAVEVAGRVEILLISFPFIEEILSLGMELL